MKLVFPIEVWLPPINLYSAPHIMKIARVSDDMLDAAYRHKEIYEEWILRGKPALEWKLTAEPESAFRPMEFDYGLSPIWLASIDFRFAASQPESKESHPTSIDEQYWFKKGYNRAIEDIRNKLKEMPARHCLKT